MTISHHNLSNEQKSLLPFPSHWCGISHCPVSLRQLFPQASFVGCADIRVTHVANYSDDCTTGVLFAAIPGTLLDGISFVEAAIQNGATSIMVEQPLSRVAVPQIVVANVRKAYAVLNAALNSNPSAKMNIAAVTGTNGKTTVTWLVRSIIRSAGHRAGLLGTIEYDDSNKTETATLSTPDAKTLSHWLGSMVEQNVSYAAMEVTSHALDQHRLAGTLVDVAVVTNITQDHFDYHKNNKSYQQCKATLQNYCKPGGTVILNLDDIGSSSLQTKTDESLQTITYSLLHPANITATIQEMTLHGSRFLLSIDGEEIGVSTTLIGQHNISNCLAAAAVAHRFGISLDDISAGIASLETIPGRMERIECGQAFDLFVDYAHTDDALHKTISALRELTTKRIITVFGAGGNRDRSKRALLGKAASLADVAVVTSDNPRTENPQQIVDEILSGLSSTETTIHIELDREAAIRWAIADALPGDILLVAGKGHETEQIVGSERIPFDDRTVCRNCVSELLEITQQKQAVSA